MLPQRILKIKGLRLAKNAFLAFQSPYKMVKQPFDTCNVKLLGLTSLSFRYLSNLNKEE